ncbi:hypothetical protein PT974_00504 [Cladobotryum mycophilum]|uniref:Asteroid domain-containing protein n=1 Tax=Cladobotryum mycophilum TaxID=491253 RepID=A0ABR0T1U6_9HYPO
MGIPHLIATLERYAEYEVLENETVVIDGPALAYHILYMCRANAASQPSYGLLGQAAIAWLDELQNHRVNVQHIYFDGYLPASKQSVRMERIMKSNTQLNLFFSSNTKGYPSPNLNSSEELDFDVFKFGKPGTKSSLDPSFLVPAVIDAIRSCPRYQKLFSIVPGEADAYCANYLSQNGGMVMTSDSDLLAYELAGGRVAFFREIHRNAHEKLSCATFCPRNIYKKLGLPASTDAWRLAYERKRSTNATLPQILKACSLPIIDGVDYQEFCQQYLHHEKATLPTTRQNNTLSLDGLDPRLSELLLQLGQMRPNSNLNGLNAKIFLPILIESPEKGTAWEPSTPIRRLAYSIATWILLPTPSASVHEYRRVQNRDQKGREVSLLPWNVVSTKADHLLSLMRQLKHKLSDVDKYFWTLFCLALNIMECEEQGKYCHVLQILRQSKKPPSNPGDKVPWDLVHFTAQLQASYYSFRILSQVLFLIPKQGLDSLSKGLLQVRDLLSEFPPLPQFPDTRDALSLLEVANKSQFLTILEELTNITSTLELEVKKAEKPKETKKRKKKGSEPPRKVPTTPGKPSKDNMFSLLAVD